MLNVGCIDEADSMKMIRVGLHSLVLVIADIAGIAGGAIAAFRILGVANQIVLQLPIAILISVGSFWGWMFLLRVFGLGNLQLVSSKELGNCLLFSVLWAPLVFVPLHYFTQGYLTSLGNLIAVALYQLPVNALALFGPSILQKLRSDGSAQGAAPDGGAATTMPNAPPVGLRPPFARDGQNQNKKVTSTMSLD